jgi:hypothetical protein
MDNAQLRAVTGYMLDDSRLKAFITARLGNATPTCARQIIGDGDWGCAEVYMPQAKALAGLLREIADGIDPPDAA